MLGMRIFLVRHGESRGNIEPKEYLTVHDPAIPLTQSGYEQALEAGAAIKKYLEERGESFPSNLHGLKLWHSPFLRTKQTSRGILEGLGSGVVTSIGEDIKLREQNFG